MAKKDRATQLPADRPEFPKPLVRLKADANGPGGYGCEVRLAGDADGEKVAADEGFVASTNLTGVLAGYQEYPRWLYHPDGRRQVVYTQAEADALEGFVEVPVDEEPDPKAGVPSPVGDAVAVASKNRPPVPVDRG